MTDGPAFEAFAPIVMGFGLKNQLPKYCQNRQFFAAFCGLWREHRCVGVFGVNCHLALILCGFQRTGQGWIRTSEGVSQWIYSPPRLATPEPTRLLIGSVPRAPCGRPRKALPEYRERSVVRYGAGNSKGIFAANRGVQVSRRTDPSPPKDGPVLWHGFGGFKFKWGESGGQ